MNKHQKSVLYLYSENSRIQIKEIASILTKSSQRIKYNLNNLEKDKYVRNPFIIFDYSHFGLLLFRVYFKGAYVSEKEKETLIENLKKNDYVVAIYELIGEFDLVLEIIAPNPSRFNKIVKTISKYPRLNNYKTNLNIVSHMYPRNHLLKNRPIISNINSEIIIGGDRKIIEYNSQEMKIIEEMYKNPKIRLTKLSRNVGSDIKTVKKNLNSLQIIKGFKFIVDSNKLSLSKFRLFLKLHNLKLFREQELLNYLKETGEIVLAHKTIGDWDLEIDLEAFDKARIRQLTLEIRDKFSDIIETFNRMEFFDSYYRTYLPKYLFNN